MDTASLAPSARKESREARGLRLYRDHASEIVRSAEGRFSVPSATEAGKVYEGIDLKRSTCPCKATVVCCHIYAATIREAKLNAHDARRMEAARERASKRERIRFTPAEVERNLARMGA